MEANMGDYGLGWEDGYEDCFFGYASCPPWGESYEYYAGYWDGYAAAESGP